MLLVQRERLREARRLDRPECQPMGRDERVALDGYAAENPADVARQLGDAAQLFANDLDRLGGADWDRSVIYSYPRRAERSLRCFFFQAEDGIRDDLVTGVQTCALPI